MNVLSLFDGISVAKVALERAGFPVERYLASEINIPAMEVSFTNHHLDVTQMGDVKNIVRLFGKESRYFRADGGAPKIDLLIGGSPCQDLSIAKQNREGLKGARSGLFYEYLRILQELKPTWFILENVASMPKEARAEITKALGVEPIMIDAALVSGQTRKRLFWTNIPNVTQPADRGIMLKDILEPVVDEKYYVKEETLKKMRSWGNPQSGRIRDIFGKSVTLQAGGGGAGAKTGLYVIVTRPRGKNEGAVNEHKAPTLTTSSFEHNNYLWELIDNGEARVRRLTPIECERLQGLPDNYTNRASDTERYRMCGNAFNANVIAHILSFIPR